MKFKPGDSLIPKSCDLCDRQAVIELSDCQYREPQEQHGKNYLRMKRCGRSRAFCKYHMRPARLLAPSGRSLQEIEVL